MWLLRDPEMNKQGASGKRKHLIVTIPQKLERIRRVESDRSCSVIVATHDIGLSTVYTKKQEYQFVWRKE
jgi:hypothetical protein